MLRIGDPDDMLALRAATAEAVEFARIRDANLAVEIANRVGQLFPKGKRKG